MANSKGTIESDMTRIQKLYNDEVKSKLREEFGYKNIMQIPKIEKINVNVGMGESLNNKNAIEAMQGDLTLITGQKPVVTRAKISIANFNLREGMNKFLSTVDVTFRRDHDTKRPRINKHNSRKDREQRAKGEYFYTE